MFKSRTGDISRTISFSGHRQIKPANQHSLFGWDTDKPEYHWNYMTGATEGYLTSVQKKLVDILGKVIEEGCDTFICGMAVGFDLMAGSAVCDLIDGGERISIVAAIPFPGQADRFSSADRETYDRIIRHASLVHTVCDSYSRDCFRRRNDYLVDNASTLVCFYNGSPGGTHYTVRKALRAGLRIINLA